MVPASMSHVAIVFTHEESEGPAEFGPALRRAGFTLELRDREVRPGDEDADLVVVMGGPMGAYETDKYPFLADELALVRRRLEQQRPVVGICLGAQILALAAGSKVYPGKPGLVIGVLPVSLTAQGVADPLFGGFEERFDVVHWHQDTFDPIPGAVLLASSGRYPQEAFRLGNSWGFQFHPEVDAAIYERWVRDSPEEIARTGRTVDDVLKRDLPRLRAAMRTNMLLVERVARFCAREVGVTFKERFLFTVESAVSLKGGGMILSPGIPRRAPIIRVGEALTLVRPDQSRVKGVVRGLAAFGTEESQHVPLLVQLEDPTAEIPAGTEAVTEAPHELA